MTIAAALVTVYPTWVNTPGAGGDIAIITLATAAPTTAERYDINRSTNELFKTFTFYGYGGEASAPPARTW